MEHALAAARAAGAHGEVPVGAAVFSDNNTLLASAGNRVERDGDALQHAEMIALRQASKKLGAWRLSGCAMYVTLEPCAMCAAAIAQCRVSRLYWGASDPKSGGIEHNACVFSYSHHVPELYPSVMEDECRQLLERFFEQIRHSHRAEARNF